MKITIQGRDYSSALDAVHPLTIARRLGKPVVCRMWLSLPVDGSLAQPIRNQPIAVQGEDGSQYFSGYLAATLLAEYVGLGMQGPRYRMVLEAISSERLLETASAADNTATSSTPLVPSVYRGANGALVQGGGTGVVHELNEDSGSLDTSSLVWTGGDERALANDFTVCGSEEPTGYVTEFLKGDGVTVQFFLADKPYFPPASQESLIHVELDRDKLDSPAWSNTGSPGYLQPGAGGLSMLGGRGTDGTTTLTWNAPVEMGGTLLLEATGVVLQAGSTGIVPGFYVGGMTQAGCVAGFRATAAPGTGAVTLQPVVVGTPSGLAYVVNSANQYALRIRVHCPEMQRQLSIFRTFNGTALNSYGGQTNQATARLLFEVQEFVDGVAGMPVVLYDGTVANLPPACTVAAASSINLLGTVRSLSLQNLGSGWVMTTPTGGSAASCRIGSQAMAAECQLDRAGRLEFFTGFAPPAGELIAVSYRMKGRAAGRAVNTAGQAELTAAGLPPVSVWMGTVTSPAARNSQDCRNAAQALAGAAAEPGTVWKGVCKAVNASLDADVWPGDALHLNALSADFAALVVVRSVTLQYRSSIPDLVEYSIDFANDWADELSLHATAAVPSDAILPAPLGGTFAANLSGLAVTANSGSAVTVDAGNTAPEGGGFEVRRRDNAFGPGADADLVLRATTSTMSFTRTSATDRFYIRMYDGAAPPNYSEFSTALIFNMPLGA